jgi:hypothetical protein
MPLKRCQENNQKGWKWGDEGKCYTGEDGKEKALQQGRAIGDYELETYNDYPKSASNNACRALKWVEENGWGDCGEDTGKQRAHQLCKGENISRDTIARMASFKRHQQHKDVPYSEGCGGLMWDAWGGTSGIEWAQRKLEQIDEMEKIEVFSRYIRKDMRISIDYDGIITNKAIIDILNSLKPFSIKELFIITNRMDTGMIRLANKLDIPRNRIIRVKDDVQKYNEIINNRIDYHVDNNRNFLNIIGDRGVEI